MKLFIWRDVLYDWTGGIAFAMAENVGDARALICEAYMKYHHSDTCEEMMHELSDEPEVHEAAAGGFCYGGA